MESTYQTNCWKVLEINITMPSFLQCSVKTTRSYIINTQGQFFKTLELKLIMRSDMESTVCPNIVLLRNCHLYNDTTKCSLRCPLSLCTMVFFLFSHSTLGQTLYLTSDTLFLWVCSHWPKIPGHLKCAVQVYDQRFTWQGTFPVALHILALFKPTFIRRKLDVCS